MAERTYVRAAIDLDAIGRKLMELEPDRVTLAEVLDALKPKLAAQHARGVSLEKIRDVLRESGLRVSLSRLRELLKRDGDEEDALAAESNEGQPGAADGAGSALEGS